MSLDVTSYWQPAALTANGLIRYEADEVALYCTQTAHVDIECGGDGAKHTYKAGHAHVTSHRIVWVRERSASGAQTAAAAASSSPATAAAVCLPLDAVERVEQKVSAAQIARSGSRRKQACSQATTRAALIACAALPRL